MKYKSPKSQQHLTYNLQDLRYDLLRGYLKARKMGSSKRICSFSRFVAPGLPRAGLHGLFDTSTRSLPHLPQIQYAPWNWLPGWHDPEFRRYPKTMTSSTNSGFSTSMLVPGSVHPAGQSAQGGYLRRFFEQGRAALLAQCHHAAHGEGGPLSRCQQPDERMQGQESGRCGWEDGLQESWLPAACCSC